MKKEIDLQYIREHGLRDVEIKEISINYTEKRIVFTLFGFSGSKLLKMELREITLLEISKVDTFYGPEIILEYLIDEKNSVINIYTSSDSVYRIKFGDYSFWMDREKEKEMERESDPMQGLEEFSCKVNLQGNQTLKKPVYSYPGSRAPQSRQCNCPFYLSPVEHSADIVPPESLTRNSPLKSPGV